MLIQAGVFAELDKINGVAANIILGQVAPCGTGDSEILIDEAALQVQGHEVPLPTAASTSAVEVKKDIAMTPHMPQLPKYSPGAEDATQTMSIESDDLEIV